MIEADCPFCSPDPARVAFESDLVFALRDAFPVSPGHLLVVPRRHVATWFESTSDEKLAILGAIDQARERIGREHQPDGYNLGVNVGAAAGQTVFHLHVHVIPRYVGDVADPRGGVRRVIPHLANYLVPGASGVPSPVDGPRLFTGGESDPLYRALVDQLAKARNVDIAVGFVLSSGVYRLYSHFEDLLRFGGGSLRLLTGDYLGVTDPDALARLLDLGPGLRLRVFQTGNGYPSDSPGSTGAVSFHPKAYLVHRRDGTGIAFIGSSNLSESALLHGIEWNYRVVSSAQGEPFGQVKDSFERLWANPAVADVTNEWIDGYRQRRGTTPDFARVEVTPEPALVPEPHAIQQEALAALEATRTDGFGAGLVVMATGLGKTWLAAFDAYRGQFRRVLFVAHRDEILAQSLATFRKIRPGARLGLYTGRDKDQSADVLFASVQTLGRATHLDRFPQSAFDYIVVDEFHHASAPTYRRLIQHFQPRFLLGLTATPERTDGGDLLALCQENLVYRCDLVRGVAENLLCRFQYFGVPDTVDYRNIPWRNARFDVEELTARVATEARARNALEQLRVRGGTRTMAFCVSQRHADYMASFFRDNGLRAVAVHSGPSSAPRAISLDQLAAGELDVVCAVDVFNEGLDLPELDTVLMLRPTESRILWLQQFGRGLRKSNPEKELRVIDYIGNHRVFLLKPEVLTGVEGDRDIQRVLAQIRNEGRLEIAPGCFVTYDLAAIDILEGLLRIPRDLGGALSRWYDDFVQRHDVRPTAVEALHDGYNPRSLRRTHGSWLAWVDQEKRGLTEALSRARQRHGPFLDALETTEMTKSYKMLVLIAMLDADRFPGGMQVDELATRLLARASHSPRLMADLGTHAASPETLVKLLREYPLRVWSEGRGTHGERFFQLDGDLFTTTFTAAGDDRIPFQELSREVVDWRLAEYLLREGNASSTDYVLKVAQASGRPMLFLPDRDQNPGLPSGPTQVQINGINHEADFAHVALNVVRQTPATDNRLPGVLREWFGPDAGMPGTRFEVALSIDDDSWHLRPRGRRTDAIEHWREYPRRAIPSLFGFKFSEALWNSGLVSLPGHLFLLVTIDKSGKSKDHQYRDRFLSPAVFQWESQNRTRRASKPGELIREHASRGVAVHLFVRRTGKLLGGGAAPFLYCGDVQFENWEGDQPITVRWRLSEPLPDHVSARVLTESGN
jgi:superfamily II DNA or RNA helicase/diadenosine tetraphosphate (Ap4A) HIT family hydrolase/HKD family nuclease